MFLFIIYAIGLQTKPADNFNRRRPKWSVPQDLFGFNARNNLLNDWMAVCTDVGA